MRSVRPGRRGLPRSRGYSLIEMSFALILIALLATVGFANLLSSSGRTRVQAAAAELSGALALARSLAIRYNERVGVKFYVEAGEAISYAIYRDGDADGVLTRDIEDGTDPQEGPRRDLEHMGRGVGFGFPPGEAPRDPGDPSRRLDRLDDPIRFNNSDIASFDPLGGATPGSIYVTDDREALSVVRVFGRSGRIRTLRYHSDVEEWR